jgi:hypothetical protein
VLSRLARPGKPFPPAAAATRREGGGAAPAHFFSDENEPRIEETEYTARGGGTVLCAPPISPHACMAAAALRDRSSRSLSLSLYDGDHTNLQKNSASFLWQGVAS